MFPALGLRDIMFCLVSEGINVFVTSDTEFQQDSAGSLSGLLLEGFPVTQCDLLIAHSEHKHPFSLACTHNHICNYPCARHTLKNKITIKYF